MSRSKRLLYLVLCVSLFNVPMAMAASWTAKVTWVADGDTVYVDRQGTRVKIRLHGVDTPEKAMPYGPQASAFTKKLVMGKTVRVIVKDKDRYGRSVAVVMRGRINLNHALVKAGLAWHYKRYSRSATLAALGRRARRRKIGLWKQANPEAPWKWRRRNRRRRGRRGYRRYRRGYKRYRRGYKRTKRGRYYRRRRRYHPAPPTGTRRKHRKGKLVYHGNKRSKTLHAPGCTHYNCKNCVVIFRSLAQAKQRGFRPHRKCVNKP